MASYTRKSDKTPDKDLLVKLDGFFRSALDHPTWISWRTDAVKCFKYKEGDQWTTEELGVLSDRGQAPSVNNQISVTINRLVGQFVKFKTRLAFRGRNAPQDEPLAQAYTDIFRFIAQNSDLEYEEREMADDGFTAGFGVLETQVVFGEDHKPEILIKHEDVSTSCLILIRVSTTGTRTLGLSTAPSGPILMMQRSFTLVAPPS